VQPTLHFTADWLTRHIPLWEQFLLPLAGQPNLRFLEIGSFEGRSACWLLQHILTHETSSLTCVDPFEEGEELFDRNIIVLGARERVKKLKGRSAEILRALPLDSFDVIYIDGWHTSPAVLTDAVLAWDLLKDGGLLIFDDYEWSVSSERDASPKFAIDSFLAIFARDCRLLSSGWQVIARKSLHDGGRFSGRNF
jgi:predicted O-methyltransferase YrrM